MDESKKSFWDDFSGLADQRVAASATLTADPTTTTRCGVGK